MAVMNVPIMAQRILIRDDVMNPHVQVSDNNNEKRAFAFVNIYHMIEKLKDITQ